MELGASQHHGPMCDGIERYMLLGTLRQGEQNLTVTKYPSL